jgi:hypothetical protein
MYLLQTSNIYIFLIINHIICDKVYNSSTKIIRLELPMDCLGFKAGQIRYLNSAGKEFNLPIGIFFFNTGQYNSQEQHARVCCTRW